MLLLLKIPPKKTKFWLKSVIMMLKHSVMAKEKRRHPALVGARKLSVASPIFWGFGHHLGHLVKSFTLQLVGRSF